MNSIKRIFCNHCFHLDKRNIRFIDWKGKELKINTYKCCKCGIERTKKVM